MIAVFLVFIAVSVAMLYAVWFVPQDGKMLSLPEQIAASCFVMLFLGFGVWGIYSYYIYVPSPIKPHHLADEIITWYDADKDGKIRLKRETSVIRCESSISCRVYGRSELFNKADADRDSLVTLQELTTLVATFDKDKNGKIDYVTEMKTFNKQYPQYSSNGFRKDGIRFKKEPLVE
jgi:Ca2+-binding EF-hand superfamily protein